MDVSKKVTSCAFGKIWIQEHENSSNAALQAVFDMQQCVQGVQMQSSIVAQSLRWGGVTHAIARMLQAKKVWTPARHQSK